MVGMTDESPSDPLELRVLAALTSGAATADDVAMRTEQPTILVAPILEQAVAEQTVTRLGRGRTPAYSLTPKGLHAVGIAQSVKEAVDGSGHVDLGAAARMVMEEYDAARDVATEDAVREQAGWPADATTRDQVTQALNDAYARGGLTREQLDTRTSLALTASTMGELRAAGDGVIVLTPALPTGVGPVTVGPRSATRVEVNPALRKVTWRHVVYAATYVVLGLLFLIVLHSVFGVAVVVAGLGLAAFALRPLWRSGSMPTPED
jgi:hypothetical protein